MSADKRLIGMRLRQAREEPPYWSRPKMARLLQLAAQELEHAAPPGIESLTTMIKDWESGKHSPSPYYRGLYAHALGRTEKNLFRPAPQVTYEPVDEANENAWLINDSTMIDSLALAWTLGRLDQRLDRRAVLQIAGSLATIPAMGMVDPVERLAHALTHPTGLTEDLVEYLESRSLGFHRLEVVVPASQIFRGLLAHLNEITTLLQICSPGSDETLRTRLVRTAGETAALGAWCALDVGEAQRAASLYRTTELAAKESRDPAILACSVLYQSLALTEAGAHRTALRGLTDARQALPKRGDLATRGWLLAREAEETAAMGDPAAKDMIKLASELFLRAQPMRERSWTRILEPSYLDTMRLTIATRLADRTNINKCIGDLTTLISDPAPKKNGRDLASVGLALVAVGDIHEGIRIGHRALEAIQRTQARYALGRLTQLGAALTGTSRQERDLRENIRATRQQLLSPRPPVPGTHQTRADRDRGDLTAPNCSVKAPDTIADELISR